MFFSQAGIIRQLKVKCCKLLGILPQDLLQRAVGLREGMTRPCHPGYFANEILIRPCCHALAALGRVYKVKKDILMFEENILNHF